MSEIGRGSQNVYIGLKQVDFLFLCFPRQNFLNWLSLLRFFHEFLIPITNWHSTIMQHITSVPDLTGQMPTKDEIDER